MIYESNKCNNLIVSEADADASINDIDTPQIGRTPTFVTLGQTYRIATGSTVVLPCRISEPG